jgi:hypothetical protein
MEADERAAAGCPPAKDSFSSVKESVSPPSAADLAAALAQLSRYDWFEYGIAKLRGLLTNGAPGSGISDEELGGVLRSVATLTGITSPTPPLLSVSSYAEYALRRLTLWRKLKAIFESKQTPTDIHRLIAAAASFHLRRDHADHYLIITTNYDRLMERALDDADVPSCVFTVGRKKRYVYSRFSPLTQAYLDMPDDEYKAWRDQHSGREFPSRFQFRARRPFALVYKIHGCLATEDPAEDSIVISDEDYVETFNRMFDIEGGIPGPITPLMSGRGFLFLGYSFGDWNIRSMYKQIAGKRGELAKSGDYSVMRDISVYEEKFFDTSDIHILRTDLTRFVERIKRHVPPGSSIDASTERAAQPV